MTFFKDYFKDYFKEIEGGVKKGEMCLFCATGVSNRVLVYAELENGERAHVSMPELTYSKINKVVKNMMNGETKRKKLRYRLMKLLSWLQKKTWNEISVLGWLNRARYLICLKII